MIKIKIGIYNAEMELYIGKTKKNIKKMIKRHGKEHADFLNRFDRGFCFACMFEKKYGGSITFIMIMNKKSKAYHLYHESLHLAYYILDSVGVKHNVNNHEALIYLQGYIAEKVKKHLKLKI